MGDQRLLISEPPLQVLPSLATKIGLNEAIVLQQFHYWLQHSNNLKDGHKWVYNSYAGWLKQFPFWGRNTLIRAISNLEKQKILVTGNYNRAGFDKTKWYRINYEAFEGVGKRSTQNGQTNTNRLPETTTRDINTTTTTANPEASKSDSKNQNINQKQKYEDPITLYRENAHPFIPNTLEQLIDWLRDFEKLTGNEDEANGIVSLALHQALDAGTLKMQYIRVILSSWLKAKVSTVEMAKAKNEEHRQQYSKPRSGTTSKKLGFQDNPNFDVSKLPF